MEKQRERARRHRRKRRSLFEDVELTAEPTKFLGYDFLETESVVEAVLPGRKIGRTKYRS